MNLKELQEDIFIKEHFYNKVRYGNILAIGVPSVKFITGFVERLSAHKHSVFSHPAPVEYCVTQDARIIEYNKRFEMFEKLNQIDQFEVAAWFCPMIYVMDAPDIRKIMEEPGQRFQQYMAVGRARNIMHVLCLTKEDSDIYDEPFISGLCDLLIADRSVDIKEKPVFCEKGVAVYKVRQGIQMVKGEVNE